VVLAGALVYAFDMNKPGLLTALATAGLLLAPAAMAQTTPINITPPEAHKMAAEKKALLIDIRRPDEWAETGVGEHALKIDMEDPMFLTKLNAALGNDRTKPVALICRSASRTRVVQQALQQQGYTRVINVEGGMSGNRDDKGWIAHGLPVTKGQ
jgi:rhodanese-related sulfurtransferase